jgi:polyisoprenoid-binding protein YceI
MLKSKGEKKMENSGDYSRITPEELLEKMKSGDKFSLIDTLTNDHFRKVHLPNAENACVFEVVFLENISKITKDKGEEIILYGFSEKTMDAPMAADKLQRTGYEKVRVLEGGIESWGRLGYALEGEDPDFPLEATHSVTLQDGTYTVDPGESLIEWTGRNPFTKHHGTVALSAGEIIMKDGLLTGSFEIDMKSIKNINLEGDPLQSVLISHLLSDDFFFVERYPKAKLTIHSGKLVSEPNPSSPNLEMEGLLELMGIKKEIAFQATVNPDGQGGYISEAHFDFDRTRWNIIYGSTRFFEHLGMHLVFDLISLQVKILCHGS